MKKVFISFILTSTLFAQSFDSGSCTSMGHWTQKALDFSKQLRTVISQIKADKDQNNPCSAMLSVLEKFDRHQQAPNYKEVDPIIEGSNPEMAFHNEASLREVSVSSGQGAPTLLGSILDNHFATNMSSESRNNLSTTSDYAVSFLSELVKVLPSSQSCFVGRPAITGKILNGSLSMLATLAGTGVGGADGLNGLIQTYINFWQDHPYLFAMREQDKVEFIQNVSCLMESATDLHCSIEDASRLMDFYRDNKDRTDQFYTGVDKLEDHPLEGYLILNRELPIATDWLTQVIVGVEPRLKAEANYKVNVLEDVMTTIKDSIYLQGEFKEGWLVFQDMPDKTSKRNALLDLIGRLTNKLISDSMSGSMDGQTNQNFFTFAVQAEKIPFYLIGYDAEQKLPDEVVYGAHGIPAIHWKKYMLNGGLYIDQFADPDRLLTIIEDRVKSLIKEAEARASDYFVRRFIVDRANLVAESLTGQSITPFEAFIRIKDYLYRLYLKYSATPELRQKHGIQINKMAMTMNKINSIIKLYDVLKGIHVKTDILRKNGAKENDEVVIKFIAQNEELLENFDNVIDEIYQSFNMIIQRHTFLKDRVSQSVRYEYTHYTRHQNLEPYLQDLLLVSGKDLLMQLTMSLGDRPAEVEADLNNARYRSQINLNTIERVFKNSLVPMMEELKMIHTKGHNDDRHLTWNNLKRLFKDSTHSGPTLYPLIYNRVVNNDRYQFSAYDPRKVTLSDDRYESVGQILSRLCIQTLGFKEKKLFLDICNGMNLTSPQKNTTTGAALSANYSSFLYDYIQEKRSSDLDQNKYSCAYRDFKRKNWAHFLLMKP